MARLRHATPESATRTVSRILSRFNPEIEHRKPSSYVIQWRGAAAPTVEIETHTRTSSLHHRPHACCIVATFENLLPDPSRALEARAEAPIPCSCFFKCDVRQASRSRNFMPENILR